ncbi:hypothetical protein MAHJHV65_30700 [Mycobacterium avium subsp. hominissuis]
MERLARDIEQFGGLGSLDHECGEESSEDEHVAQKEDPRAAFTGDPPGRRCCGRRRFDSHDAATVKGSTVCSALIDRISTAVTAIIHTEKATNGTQKAKIPFQAAGPR